MHTTENGPQKTGNDSTGKCESVALPVDLRDYFAGQAMQGMLAMMAHPSGDGDVRPPKVASEAFVMADAMLAERERQAPE